MLRKIWRVFAGAATFAAVILFSASAQAGIIRGAWDPDFGVSYPQTGFRGFVKFSVPDACLPAGQQRIGYIADDINSCSEGGMYLIEASATLYDNTNNEDLSTIVFAPPVQSPDPVRGVFVDWDGKNLLAAELQTDLIGAQPSGIDDSSVAPTFLYLRFSWGQDGPDGETLDPGAYLIGCSYGDGETCVPLDGQQSNRATVTYTTPEPGSSLLLLSAIGAGWLVRRRAAAA